MPNRKRLLAPEEGKQSGTSSATRARRGFPDGNGSRIGKPERIAESHQRPPHHASAGEARRTPRAKPPPGTSQGVATAPRTGSGHAPWPHKQWNRAAWPSQPGPDRARVIADSGANSTGTRSGAARPRSGIPTGGSGPAVHRTASPPLAKTAQLLHGAAHKAARPPDAHRLRALTSRSTAADQRLPLPPHIASSPARDAPRSRHCRAKKRSLAAARAKATGDGEGERFSAQAICGPSIYSSRFVSILFPLTALSLDLDPSSGLLSPFCQAARSRRRGQRGGFCSSPAVWEVGGGGAILLVGHLTDGATLRTCWVRRRRRLGRAVHEETGEAPGIVSGSSPRPPGRASSPIYKLSRGTSSPATTYLRFDSLALCR
ncbi:hypothetical protein BRADI_4g18304v3 [Brachypodium distachyon]|uniref:Uncharacterized protein n=1 Tax=Brachypodium distachyon TaxID=15368 RepID=A0A0Q3PGM0_BRADI|nr:hypothetical protein BRADI_4g18304v3 [Brachypodium distachyon]